MPDHPEQDAFFFSAPAPAPLGEIAQRVNGTLPRGGAQLMIENVAPIPTAGPRDLTFLHNRKYLSQIAGCRAGACLIGAAHVEKLPDHIMPCLVAEPYSAWARILAHLYPQATSLARSARLSVTDTPPVQALPDGVEDGCILEPGVRIGDGAQIGRGSFVGANAVIGPQCRIGRHSAIGANCVVQYALLGDRVTLHPGCLVGQDGFGVAMGASRHRKVPQIGRVIIQDDVEIGAGTTIDRGALGDTVIGSGTWIDNQVQIGHNTQIGRHCVIVAQVGIAGSCKIGDFVAIGGQAGLKGHITIGDGAQIAAASAVGTHVPARASYGGVPAQAVANWMREITLLRRLLRKGDSMRG